MTIQHLKTETLKLRIEPSLRAAAEEAAAREHRTMSSWVRHLVAVAAQQSKSTASKEL